MMKLYIFVTISVRESSWSARGHTSREQITVSVVNVTDVSSLAPDNGVRSSSSHDGRDTTGTVITHKLRHRCLVHAATAGCERSNFPQWSRHRGQHARRRSPGRSRARPKKEEQHLILGVKMVGVLRTIMIGWVALGGWVPVGGKLEDGLEK
jgi:hypothetical protein